MHEPPGCLKIDFKHVDPWARPTISTSTRRSPLLPPAQKMAFSSTSRIDTKSASGSGR